MTDQQKTSESRFVGVWLSQRANTFLSLFALCKGVSKSKIIREEIETWLERETSTNPVTSLIRALTKRYQQTWDDQKRTHHNVTEVSVMFDIYKTNSAEQMKRKGVSEEHTKQVLEELIQ